MLKAKHKSTTQMKLALLCLLCFLAGRFVRPPLTPSFAKLQSTNEGVNEGTSDQWVPQVYNFVKELQCRADHILTPKILETNGEGKIYVVVGLWKGDEFFKAIDSGYSVYGFEMDPISLKALREKCQEHSKCKVYEAEDVTAPLPPYAGGYLICAGAGPIRGEIKMSGNGNSGSSFVDKSPTGKLDILVPVLSVEEVVDADIFFFQIDVQGFEYEVLKGATTLFKNRNVKTLQLEVTPKTLSLTVEFETFLRFLYHDLGMFCSTSNPIPSGPAGLAGFHYEAPGSFAGFSEYLKNWVETPKRRVQLGRFDDFLCFNYKKTWYTEPIVWNKESEIPYRSPDGWRDV